jgi:hypothetical protein
MQNRAYVPYFTARPILAGLEAEVESRSAMLREAELEAGRLSAALRESEESIRLQEEQAAELRALLGATSSAQPTP